VDIQLQKVHLYEKFDAHFEICPSFSWLHGVRLFFGGTQSASGQEWGAHQGCLNAGGRGRRRHVFVNQVKYNETKCTLALSKYIRVHTHKLFSFALSAASTAFLKQQLSCGVLG
jgi:hypothetical protein